MKRSVLIMFHLMFWIFTSLLIMLVFQIIEVGVALIWNNVKPNTVVFNAVPLLIVLPVGACIFYSFYFTLTYFLKKPYRFLWLIAAYVLFVIIIALPGCMAAKAGHKEINHLKGILATTLFVAPILYFNVFGFLFRTFIEWINDRKIKAELEKDKMESQLELLRSKINPHFLFNTINNIDVLIEKDAVKASGYLNKLSDILRFMLYETKNVTITLEKEIAYIDKYIDLQKIRTSNPDNIKFSVKGELKGKMIEPMLFIPFIENAFKHSESGKTNAIIDVDFLIEKERITFQCSNTYGRPSQTNEGRGVGNELIQKRLNLLYPNKHILNIEDKEGAYKVKLLLNEN